MFFAFWRFRREVKAASARPQHRSATPRRTVLCLESLESRDLLTTVSPLLVLTPSTDSATPMASAGPMGYSPGQVSQAYGFNQIAFHNGAIQGNGSGQTIAIVDAYNDPTVAGDLHQFDQAFGLPDPPSFQVVNQNGGSALPAANSGWANEIALDVEWAHALAPGANILLVEASSNSASDLFAAVQFAAAQSGVSVVSMSWGTGQFSSEANYDGTFTTPAGHPGVSFIAAAGDAGAPASYPAASPNVLAVGGSSLYLNGSSYGSETAWSGSGGGLSSYEGQPGYQQGVVSQSTTQRATPDVSADANPSTGLAVYSSYANSSATPWIEVGGTSAAVPQWAALVAIADQGRALTGLGSLDSGRQLLPALYQLPGSDFHDVASGSSSGNPSYTAVPGYDLVTGRGSPYADRIVAALSQQTTFNGSSSAATSGQASSTSTGSPTVSTANLLNETSRDAFWLVFGWEAGNFSLMLQGWQDMQSLMAANPTQAASLQQAFIADVIHDLL